MTEELIFGMHAVEALLKANPQHILEIYVLQGRHDQSLQKILKLGKQQNISISEVSRKRIDEMLPQMNHQGVVARIRKMNQYTEDDLAVLFAKLEVPFLLILDGVQDPHNLGACMRTANAAGVNIIIAPQDNSVGITPVVRKVACGAAELTPFIQVTNLARTIRWLKEQGVWVYGATGDTDQSLFKTDLRGSVAIVLGSEGKGLRHLTRELCDHLVTIPMFGSVESLNVSVAAGICLFEVSKQRNN